MAKETQRRLRFNLASINPEKVKTNAQGGIVVDGVVIKTGVFLYETEDGGEVREYLPASELFKDGVMDTLMGAPVTNEHPDRMITPENFKTNAVGFIQEVKNEGDKYLVAKLMINDRETIEDIVKGRKRELSAGYFTEPVRRAGLSPDGEKYDVIQTDILFNHASLVTMGRCGPDVALRLNSKGNQEMRMSGVKPILKSKSVTTNSYKKRQNIIREEGGEFCVFSKDGDRSFGCYKTKEEAEERLREIHAFAENKMSDKKNELDKESNKDEEKENAEELVALMADVQEELGVSYEELVTLLSESKEGLVAMLRDEMEPEDSEESGEEDENMNSANKKKPSKPEVKKTKAEKEAEEKFNKMVEDEVEARMGLLVAAKQLGVKELKPSLRAEELRLMIVKTAKPHMSLEGRSEDFMQALLEDSLSNVDIDSFWVTPEASDESGKDESANGEKDELAQASGEAGVDEDDFFDGAPDEAPVQETTLNSLLKTVRSKSRANDVGGKSPKDDIYGSVEERARMLLDWQGKKLI